MAELQLPKLATRVRFPSPAPNKNPFGFFFSAFRSGTSVRIWSPFRLRAKFSLSLRNLPSLPFSLFGRRLARFPSPAPNKNPFGFFFSAFRSGTSVRIWSPFRLHAKFSLSLRNLPSLLSSLFGRRLARFPSPAPFLAGFPLFFYFGLGNLCSNLVAFSYFFELLLQNHFISL